MGVGASADTTVRTVAHLSGTGVWSFELRHFDPGEVADAASELEALGYSALWIPDIGGPVFEALDRLLAATSTITVATGILNVWKHTPAEVGAWWSGLAADAHARVLLGVGISHAPLIGDTWSRPLAVMRE